MSAQNYVGVNIVPTAALDLQGLDVHPTVFVLTELVS
jgi:hypothetical protein